MQKDNSTLAYKSALRRRVLIAESEPVVLETHGGHGRIYERVWYAARSGVVIEKDRDKADFLAQQRPTWRVYSGDSEKVLAAGLAADVQFNIIDLDPYGSPFDTLLGFFAGHKRNPPRMQLVVNDGMRQKAKVRGAWSSRVLAESVQRFGNNIYPVYLGVVHELVAKIAGDNGYRVTHFEGYYCGHSKDMTHYWATLESGHL